MSFSHLFIALNLVILMSITGCQSATTTENSKAIQVDDELVAVVNHAEYFVHSNLFVGIKQVQDQNRAAWNQMLSVYACGSLQASADLSRSFVATSPVFVEKIRQLAQQENVFSTPQDQLVLNDVAQLAYRLFTASYATGYARQIRLAEELVAGIQDDFCGGQIYPNTTSYPDMPGDSVWSSFNGQNWTAKSMLEAHVKNGVRAFDKLVQQQYLQFDALVYSHAYQATESYQALFFEVNRYENVEGYGRYVVEFSSGLDAGDPDLGFVDFAYLVLTSGYHWGMMSILAIVEEDFPQIHDLKKQQASEQIQKATDQLDRDPG